MSLVFKLWSRMPLWLLHGLGWALGWAAFLGSSVYRRRFLDNVRLADIQDRRWRAAVGEAGKLVMELPRLWQGAAVPVQWQGQDAIDDALKTGRGIVFLTPHLGCFEVAGQAYAERYGCAGHPLTALYRPPRQSWLRHWVEASRARPGLLMASTTLAGVKQMIKALNQGHSVAMLPDQVPPEGMGLWLPFFGRDAYTMTLSARLALQTDAVVLLAWGERLAWGRGYVVHVSPLGTTLAEGVDQAVLQINAAMEELVRQAPEQYLWGYARYKQPRSQA